jgi:hypothetical protein
MHVGDEEPDIRAITTTLTAIRDHPSHFSYGAISLAAGTAVSILKGIPVTPEDSGEITSHCEGQLSLHDELES